MVALNLPFKALADPTRREIIMLLKKESLTPGEIAEHFDMTKPSISHHLNMLKQADLVSDERKGQKIYYSLNTTVLQNVIGWFLDTTHYNEGDDINDEKDS
ncbi:MAG TPA: autorepressor SdpR family transcription factor [Clostridium sp.]